MTHRFAALPLLALGLSIAVPAAAQERAADRRDADTIVVTAQSTNATEVVNGGDLGPLGDVDALDAPFTIRSFDESLILNQQPLSLGEVLNNDPTVRTSYGFGNAAELFVIRGFPLNGDDLGLNGLYGVAPRQLTAPELYSSVQVLNGANAFLNGAAPSGSGVGGAVNLVLKRAGNDLTRATLGFNAVSQFGGSFDVARRFGENREWGVRVNGAYRDGETAVEGEDRRTRVLGGSVDYDGGNFRAALDVAYQNVRVDNLRPKITIASAAIPRVPASDANYAQDFSYSELRDIFGTLNLEYDLAANATAYVKAGARDGREDGIYSGVTVTDAATGAATGSALLVPRTDNNEAVEGGVRIALGSAITQKISFGGNYIWQTNRNAYDFLGGFGGFPTNLYNTPQRPQLPTGFVGGDLDHPFPVAKVELGSAFISDTVGFLDDRISVIGGLRLQTLRSESFSYTGGSSAGVRDDDAATPVVGVVVKPIPGIALFANRIEALQQGMVAPTQATIGGASLPVSNAGRFLDPYRSVQYEAGAKARLGGLFLSLAAYTIERPFGIVTPDPANPGSAVFVEAGRQRHRGIDFTANGELARGLRFIGGVSYIDADLRDTQEGLNDGNRAQGVPDWTANANLEWDLPFIPGLTLTGRVIYTGKQAVNPANTLFIPDWAVGSVGARYVFPVADRPVTLRVNVDNVTDEAYYASAYDSFNSALLQGRPRSVNASVSVDF